MINLLIQILKKVTMNLQEEVRRKQKRRVCQKLGYALTNQIRLFMIRIVMAMMVGADELTRLLQTTLALDVRIGSLPKIRRDIKAINLLQANGSGPIMPTGLLGYMFPSRFVVMGIRTIRRHVRMPFLDIFDIRPLDSF